MVEQTGKCIKVSHKAAPLRNRLFREHGPQCHYCEKETIPNSTGPLGRTLEHIVPRCMGGITTYGNLILACERCNSTLGDRYFKCHCKLCEAARAVYEWNTYNIESGIYLPSRQLTNIYNRARRRSLSRPALAISQTIL